MYLETAPGTCLEQLRGILGQHKSDRPRTWRAMSIQTDMSATGEEKSGNLAQTAVAHRISSNADATDAARALALEFAPGAAERDRLGKAPRTELARLAQSGLLGITIPKVHGGAEVFHETLAEVFRLLAIGDPAIAQVPQNHFVFVEVLKLDGTQWQQRFFFEAILRGARFGNALSERHP